MKDKLLFILFLFIGLGYGCDTKYDTYSGLDVVYMNETTDTTRFSFTYVDSKFDRFTQEIKIKTIGKVYDYDRAVNIKFTTESAVEGIDFEPLKDKYVVKAGETGLVLPIVMIRTEALLKEAKIIHMELLEDENFKTHYDFGSDDRTTWVKTDRLSQTLIFSEFMTQRPAHWNPYVLGVFSPLKFKVICDIMGIEREKFLDATYMGYRTNYIGQFMKKYFADEKAADRTLFEEDGVTEMAMGPQAQ